MPTATSTRRSPCGWRGTRRSRTSSSSPGCWPTVSSTLTGIEFSRGLSDADEPPIAVRDLTGRLRAWIDVGTPSPDRLHRAAKLAPRVAVYVHKDYRQWLPDLVKANIHRAGALALHAFDPQLIRALVSRLDRRLSFALTVADGELFVAFADGTVSGRMTRLEI